MMHAEERGRSTGVRYLTSHPLAAERVQSLKRLAAAAPNRSRALLPDWEWREVRRICGG